LESDDRERIARNVRKEDAAKRQKSSNGTEVSRTTDDSEWEGK